jgi:hypothetical protein
MYGWEAGAFWPYAVAGAVCAAQFFYCTGLGWCLTFLFYVVASVTYSSLLFADASRLARGERAAVLVDFGDSLVFLVWLGLLIGIAWALWRMSTSRRRVLRRS